MMNLSVDLLDNEWFRGPEISLLRYIAKLLMSNGINCVGSPVGPAQVASLPEGVLFALSRSKMAGTGGWIACPERCPVCAGTFSTG
jgi:hypothetical protein